MAKPIIKTVHAFDANESHFITFTWSGNQAYNNRLVLYDASTQAVVYDHIYSFNYYKLDHEIPAYTLDNNKQYAAQVSVIDANGDASPLSDKYYFWTIETPTFYFEGLHDGDTILSPSITLNLHYSQSGTESLVWTKFYLYNATKTEITETDADYTHTLTHTFGSLANKITYYVRATAETVHGMALDTGYIGFVTSFENPSAYARLYAEPDEDTGFVNYYSNLVIVTPDENDYEYEDGFINLTDIDTSKVATIRAEADVVATMGMYWTDANGVPRSSKTEDCEEGMTITNYATIDEIILNGAMSQEPVTYLGDFHNVDTIYNATLYVNRVPYENVTSNLPLGRLPVTGSDFLIIRSDGRRLLVRNLAYFKFGIHTEPVREETINNEYITYYDVNALAKSVANNMYCTCIPVDNPSTTSISLDYNTGYVKIIWRSDSGVTNIRQTQEFYRDNDVAIFYPASKMTTTILKQLVGFPRLENYKLLRYSQALTLTADATFMLRMKSCRRTAGILKVFKGEEIHFMLSSRVYEDGTFRLKLTVFNGGPKYTQYSEPLDIDVDDIVTVFIRRVNGIYGMYINTFESEDIDYRNVWLGDTEPSTNLTDKDLWIDLDQVLIYVPEDESTRYYQDREPRDADENSFWIGGAM